MNWECWIGFHDWEVSGGNLIANDLVTRVKRGHRCCRRCGKLAGPVFHYPPRYKYTCYECGGPLSAENARAGLDCGFCQEANGSTGDK